MPDIEETTTEAPLSKSERRKVIQSEKKRLNAEQKILDAELDETKGERKAARQDMADARKEVTENKSTLRELTAKTYPTFTGGSHEEADTLADEIEEAAEELVASVRKFAEGAKTLKEM